MQNWNQWQLSAGVTPMPQPPIGYATPTGADPMTLMQSYMQYYNQPVSMALNKRILHFFYI